MKNVKRLRSIMELDPVASLDLEDLARRAVFDDLFEDITSDTGDAESGFETSPVPRNAGGLFAGPARRIRLGALAAAVIVVLVGVLFVTTHRSNGPVGRYTTAWEPARPASGGQQFSTPAGATGQWRLVSTLVGTGWQLSSPAPVHGALTCPTTSSCYITAATTEANRTDATRFASLYFSADEGSTWSALDLPEGFQFSAPLSCWDAEHCSGAGVLNDKSMLISTTDAGHQWTVTPISAPGTVVYLSCRVTTICNAVVATSLKPSQDVGGMPPLVRRPGTTVPEPISGRRISPQELFIRTKDDGATWSSYKFSRDLAVTGLDCSAASDCVVIGQSAYGSVLRPDPAGFVFRTSDGGQSWTQGTAPQGFEMGFAVSCGDAANCLALGTITIPNPNICGRPLTFPDAGMCSLAPTWQESGVIATTDGGLTWALRPLPADIPFPLLSTISCSGHASCWISGSEAVDQPAEGSGGSGMVLGTDDGGGTWTRATFDVPLNAPNYEGQSYLSIGAISCPVSNGCLALGVVAQGSKSTPVYSNLGGPPRQ